MKRRILWKTAATALLGGLALTGPSGVRAQDGLGGGAGAPRTGNERVVTEQPVPRTANSVARDAAEGRLGPVPAQVAPGAVGPGAAADPATRLQPALVAPRAATPAPAGHDVAMLVEHAVGMAIEASALQSIAQASAPGDDPAAPPRMLLDHAKQMLGESKAMMTQAAGDGRDVSAASPARRFYSAANQYVATLAALGNSATPPSPADRAQVAMINHSVKSVLDADHIRQMGRGYAGSVALEQLLNHARDMKNEGTQSILKLAGNGTIEPDAAPSVTTLARRGRELIDAAEQLGAAMPAPAALAPVRGAPNPAALQPGTDVGVLRDTRPEIIGGTQATGSPTAGTATGAEAAANVRKARELPNGTLNPPTPNGAPGSGISGYGVGNNNTPPTNSSGGLPPR